MWKLGWLWDTALAFHLCWAGGGGNHLS